MKTNLNLFFNKKVTTGLTKWNFSTDEITDEIFWSKHIIEIKSIRFSFTYVLIEQTTRNDTNIINI